MMVCIAGKNDVAIECMKFVLKKFDGEIVGVCNSKDSGEDGYYKSYKKFLIENDIKIVKIKEIQKNKELFFFSTEFDKIINVDEFRSKNLFNIHFSLLPKYKGVYTSAMPILLDERKSGVTLHKIDNGIDTGDIVDQIDFELDAKETCDSLYKKYMQFGVELFKRNFNNILKCNFKAKKQNKIYSTYFSKKSIDYKNLKIDLNKTAYEIGKQIRAFFCPAFQYPKILGYEIIDYEILDIRSFKKAGEVLEDNEKFLIIATVDYDLKVYKKDYY